MTLQDLKDNRNEIIATINETANASKKAEIMKAMMNLVNGDMADSDNVVDLVAEVVEMNKEWQKDSKWINNLGEINRANAMANLPSSMR